MDSHETNVDRLLKARAAIDEQLRQHKTSLTVLFTDLVGSTSYFDRYGDTSGLAMLQRHADLAGNTFARFDGRVVKTIGDSVMAVFSEPDVAVRAAVELQRQVAQLNPSLPPREQLQLRIGINSGLGFRHGNDVYGDVVNVAARITKHTGPAQILISRTVHESVPANADWSCRWLAQITFAGKAEKEDIFEVLWADTAAYTALQKELTAAVARGELVCPGLRPEDLLSSSQAPTAIHLQEPAVPRALLIPASTDLALPAPVTARYEIRREVGRGGMGVVYEALDRETGEVVALKVLRPEIVADTVAMERFKNELRVARRITHKNVCRVHEFHRAEGFAYISMEFVEGESLRAVLSRSGHLGLRQGMEVTAQICAGLGEAHSQGVVHRDLKPENVMVDRVGWVKVMDFGIARSLDTSTLGAGGLVGTLLYMAPEQVEGKTVDRRADVYSLGLILYEMFTGTPAVRGENPAAVLLQHIRETPRSPRHLQPTLPVHINDAILRCLEKDPAMRFPSVNALLEVLSQPFEAHPQEAGPEVERGPRVERPLEATRPVLTPVSAEPAGPTPEPKPVVEMDFALPRPLARSLFLLIQTGYLVMYCAALFKSDAMEGVLGGVFLASAALVTPLILVSATCGIAVRLYLLSAVGLDHPAAGAKFRWLFLPLFVLDALWAASPLLLARRIGLGPALGSVAALAYLPFAQRTLMQSAYRDSKPANSAASVPYG